MRYVAMDFETANSSPCSACSIGYSVFEDDRLVQSTVQLLRPPKEFGEFNWYNIKVHGIRRSMVRDAPRFDEIWSTLLPLIEGSILVCHNAMFDTSVLCKTLAYYHIPLPSCRYICTVKVSQKVWTELENHKLDTVSCALDIALNHHEAGSDALACGMILQAALRETQCADADALAERIGMRLGVIAPNSCVSCSTAQEITRKRERDALHAQKCIAHAEENSPNRQKEC